MHSFLWKKVAVIEKRQTSGKVFCFFSSFKTEREKLRKVEKGIIIFIILIIVFYFSFLFEYSSFHRFT